MEPMDVAEEAVGLRAVAAVAIPLNILLLAGVGLMAKDLLSRPLAGTTVTCPPTACAGRHDRVDRCCASERGEGERCPQPPPPVRIVIHRSADAQPPAVHAPEGVDAATVRAVQDVLRGIADGLRAPVEAEAQDGTDGSAEAAAAETPALGRQGGA